MAATPYSANESAAPKCCELIGIGRGPCGFWTSMLTADGLHSKPTQTEEPPKGTPQPMSLWDVNGTLNNQGDPNSPYIGFDRLKSFWLNSGSFKNRRFSLVPSFKIAIDVHGDLAWLYFECHDVGDFDLDTRSIATDTFLAGMIRKADGDWVFVNMTAGKAFPLSVTQYYFPI
jgi:hypothetical protein